MAVYLLIPFYVGLLIVACAWLWLLACTFRQGVSWGVGSLVLPPIALWFAARHAQQAIKPLILLVTAGVIVAGPALYLLAMPAAALGLREDSGQASRLWSLTSLALRSDPVHEWVESRAYFLQVGAVPVVVCAWIWLLLRAFRQQRVWGWTSLLVPPVGLAFAARHPRRGTAPVVLMVLAVLVAAVPAVYILCVKVDLGPRVEIVDGQRHVTLTGWDREDYSVLGLMPDISVLQMANADVTDHVLEVLSGMKNLQELDLNGTQLSDAGLGILRDLPALATLRLARTKITDKGFRDTLSTKDSLMQLDLQHTQVSPESVKAWRSARPNRKAMQ
jgi:Leucine-rich repeat (LRR) protein